MDTFKYIYLILLLAVSLPSFADEGSKLEHKIVAGYNIGATAPTSMPEEVRSLNGWWPQFTPQLGYNIIYNLSPKWGIGSGIMLDYKGMGVREEVKYLYTEVRLEDNGDYLTGYFTGKNETRIKTSYVTVPLFGRYKINDKWNVRAGGYVSYKFSSSFKGEVWDGYMRAPDPTGAEISLTNKGDATFDFGDDVRDFDFGVLAGAEMHIKDRFSLNGNLSWGLTPIFHRSFTAMPFKMYNIYFTIGLAYDL